MTTQPFAYVAERNGKWHGIIAGDCPDKDVRGFYDTFTGFEIKILGSREDWDAYRDQTEFSMGEEP